MMKGVRFHFLFLLFAIFQVNGKAPRIWTVTAGFTYAPMYYLNPVGEHIGFGIDLIDAVCQEGKMDCRIVRVLTTECWLSNPGGYQSGGPGLMSRRYDACMGYINLVQRSNVFQFSLPFSTAYDAYLFVAKGGTIDPQRLQGKRIGFMKGWYTNEHCLARKSEDFVANAKSTEHFASVDEVIKALRAGQIAAAFGVDSTWDREQIKAVEKAAGPYACYIGGHGVMARKDSSFIANWNVGFIKLKMTNKFSKLCAESNLKHRERGSVTCIE